MLTIFENNNWKKKSFAFSQKIGYYKKYEVENARRWLSLKHFTQTTSKVILEFFEKRLNYLENIQ